MKKGAGFGIGCTMLLAECTGMVIYILAPRLIALFDSSTEVIRFGTLHARTVTLFYFLLAFSHACAAILQGAGKSAVSMGVMASVWCGIRVTYIMLVGRMTQSLQWILRVYPLTWGISSVIFIIYLINVDWMHSYE